MQTAPAIAIPTGLGDLTPAWLSHAVGAGAARPARVGGARVDRIGAGVGLMGELARVELAYEGAGSAAGDDAALPGSVVVKLPGRDPAARAAAQVLNIFEREARFYLELAPQLPIRTPRCLHADFEVDPNAPADPEAFERRFARLPIWLMRALLWLAEWDAKRRPRRAVLVLEDLAAFRPGDQVHGGDAGDWQRAIDVLARLHAAGWRNEAWLDRPWIGRMRLNVRFNQAVYRRNLRRLAPPWRDRLSGDGRRLAEWLDRHGLALFERLGRAPDTLCHTDYRLDNLLFDDATGDVAVLDWQLPTRGPGVTDLAYLLAGVLDAGVGRGEEEALVERYHAGLVAGGVDGYDLADCLADYRRAHLAAWQRCVASVAAVEPEDARGLALLESWWSRMSERLGGVDADAVLRAGAHGG